MAKRKKRKSSGTRRRRGRVSGVGSVLTPILGAVAGAAASRIISAQLGNKVDPKIVKAGQIALAAFLLPKFISGPFGNGLSMGIAGQAGIGLLQDAGVISGVADFYRVPTINGVGRMKKISGSAQQALAGVQLAQDSADVRKFRPTNYNFATGANQMAVISGFPSEYDEAGYNVD